MSISALRNDSTGETLYMAAEEFLHWYRQQPEGQRYELIDEHVVAMQPERARHNDTKMKCTAEMQRAVAATGLGCRVWADGMAVQLDDGNIFEPDAMVQRGGVVGGDDILIKNPVIVLEVLSPSSINIDPFRKLQAYMNHASIEHYLIVDPTRLTLTHVHRNAGDEDIVMRQNITAGDLKLSPPGVMLSVSAMLEPFAEAEDQEASSAQ